MSVSLIPFGNFKQPSVLGVPSTPKIMGIASSNGGTLKLAGMGLYVCTHNGFGVGSVFTYGSNSNTFVFLHENLNNSGWGLSSISFNKSTDTITNSSTSSMIVTKII